MMLDVDTNRDLSPSSVESIGTEYGRLKVVGVEIRHSTKKKRPYWHCQCECGNEVFARADAIRSGAKTDCGCRSRLNRSNVTDETGNVYGKLTVIDIAPSRGIGTEWVCKCECGNSTVTLGSNLRKGQSAHCGCSYRPPEVSAKLIDLAGVEYPGFKVLKRSPGKKGYHTMWLCACNCGNEFVTSSRSIGEGFRRNCNEGNCNINYVGFLKSAANTKYGHYKHSSKVRGHDFKLGFEDFRRLILMDCHYCGSKPSQVIKRKYKSKTREFKYNGIDRIDSSKGYEQGNVVTCCGQCNAAKSDLSCDDFYAMVKRIYDRHLSQDGFQLS